MAKKRRAEKVQQEQRELPEAKPMPHEANPGGIEGVESDWPGGSSNLGEILNPKPDRETTYSTADSDGAPRLDVVATLRCDRCGQAFHTDELLNLHRRTAHRPHG